MENAIQDEMPQFRSVLRENRAQDVSQTLRDAPRCPETRPKTAQAAQDAPQEAHKRGSSWVAERDMVPAKTPNTRKTSQEAPRRFQYAQQEPPRILESTVLVNLGGAKWSYVLDLMLQALEIARVLQNL